MKKQTLDKLEAAFEAVERDLSGRVAELAVKSTAGKLSQAERSEYEHIVRLTWVRGEEEKYPTRGDGVARTHASIAQNREDTGWILSRWWIRSLRSCASGAA